MPSTTQKSDSTSAPRSEFLTLPGPHGSHRIHYTEWGDPENPEVIFCVHGLTRNCRDFDELAKALSQGHRIVCPDMPGRGLSDWLEHAEDYNTTTYVHNILTLISHLKVERAGWVGTSMGGLIGMHLAARDGSMITRMVINDIGPVLPVEAVNRIADYVGKIQEFPSLDQAESYLRSIHAPFGILSDAQWRHLTIHSFRQDGDGYFRLRYDPGIAGPFQALKHAPPVLWDVWDRIRCPVFILRGRESDLLSAQTASEMLTRGPSESRLIEFAGIGHAPCLMSKDQIETIREWFLGAPG